MNCRRCGHALGSISALCPNCGAMMNKEQLRERKEINGGKNPYIQKLNDLESNSKWNNGNNFTNTNSVGYSVFIVISVVAVAVIIALVLLRR